MKIAVIAGKDKFADAGLETALTTAKGATFERLILDHVGDLKKELKRLAEDGTKRVLVCGGDGTLHLVVVAMVQLAKAKRMPLSLVPMGTGNDFAREMNLAGLTPEQTIEVAINGKSKAIDIGWADGRPFINVATGGAVAKNTSEAPKGLKKFAGPLAYYLNGLLRMTDLPAYSLKFTGQDFSIEEKCVAVAVANASMAGGGFQVAPHAKVNDGKLDLMVVPVQSLPKLLLLAAELTKDQPDLSKHQLFYRRVEKFDLHSQEMIQFNLDGEPIHGRDFHFHIEKNAVEFVAP